MFYILGAIAIGAAFLAIYERKKNKPAVFDDANIVPHDRQRAAYTNAEQIRAEGVTLQKPGSGMP